jgi:hypothetical protein
VVAYLQAQSIMSPSVTVSILSALLNLAGGLFLVLGLASPHWGGFGFNACPWVTTVRFNQAPSLSASLSLRVSLLIRLASCRLHMFPFS